MRSIIPTLLAAACCGLGGPGPLRGDALPFGHKIETYRDKSGDVRVFCLKLEQAFLAEEFERSNYLRLEPLDKSAYLIYPAETKFHQKHAEFYGRLRGDGRAKLRLSYEIVSENPDGSRKVEVRGSEIEVPIPDREGGPEAVFKDWARQQNAHFLNLLRYYPEDSFLAYVLLQSRTRYGVEPPDLARVTPPAASPEPGLYDVFSGALAVQQSLQRQALTGPRPAGDQNIHISQLTPPTVRSLPYPDLLEKAKKEGREPKTSDLARLVPDDHYFAHFHRFETLGELYDLTRSWGDDLLRLVRVEARDNRLLAKLETQLGLSRDGLVKLSRAGAIGEVALAGSDPFFHE